MQITLSCILLVFMIIIFLLYHRLASINNNESIRRLKTTLYAVEWIIISEVTILLVRERTYAFLAFTFYYVAMAWLIYSIFRFCIAYAGYDKNEFYKIPFFWLTAFETLAFVWGFFSKDLFTITHVRWMNHTLWASREFSFFYIYLLVSLLEIIAAIVTMLIPTLRCAKIYRPKYIIIMLMLVMLTVVQGHSMYNEVPFVFSIICIAIGEIILVYMAVYYAPKQLMQKAMLFTADMLNDGMLLYNEEHRLQFVTESFCQAFGVKDTSILDDEKKYWDRITNEMEDIWIRPVRSVTRGNDVYYYEIQHEIFEEFGKTVGTVYWIKDVTESVGNYETMVIRANYDELTGIYNEAHFYEVVKKLLSEEAKIKFLMICTKINKYRIFTDMFGKDIAQEYLKQIAGKLKSSLKEIPNCKYGRVDEDGFYILMPKDEFKENEMIESFDKITGKFSTNNFNLTVKLGIYEVLDRASKVSALCNRASMACESGSGDYQNRVIWFDEKVQENSMLMERYNAELSSAIDDGQIQIYMQPQVDSTGKVIGSEALARWIHKEDGLIPPDMYIPFFEKNGRVTEIDTCIWRQACQKLKEWKAIGREDLHISVNISARDIYALDIYEHFKGLIEEYDIKPERLKLEITESAIMSDVDGNIELIDRLHKLGFEIEMDDFGSAYSSFNMLKDLCVDVLKIDMKFLGDTENVERSQIILKSIVNLSKELKMKTVVEGVETKEQFEFLINAGCDIYQGYYFSKPISAKDFEKNYL